MYTAYAQDFGPLNLAMITQYLQDLNTMLRNPKSDSIKLYHYTPLHPEKKLNSALLIGIYQMIYLEKSPEEVNSILTSATTFISFCDACNPKSSFPLTLFDCLSGLFKAISKNWYDPRAFCIPTYQLNSTVETGGFSWIIPNKIIAFNCPASENKAQNGLKPLTPEGYSALFSSLGVSTIIRLNKKTYDCERFKSNGFNFYDLYFIDGSVPSIQILRNFIKICENEGIVAVHCKAGLGRTGTLIGCYAMKHFGFSATEFIAWARFCRPGSVLGPQQEFLVGIEKTCWAWGEKFRNGEIEEFEDNIEENKSALAATEGNSKLKSKFGEYKQGERLAGQTKSSTFKPSAAVLSKWKIAKKEVYNKSK
jgi:cell division cycle 14